ncbi:hypothetical protein M9458_040160, partial [Cirrhinus mrigala]
GVQFSRPAAKLSRQSQHHHPATALQQRCLLGRHKSTSPSSLKIQNLGILADAFHLSLPWLSVIVALRTFEDPRAV